MSVNHTSTPMEALVALCKRRGFVFQASDIYGGLNGFWDYGPLGTQLKNNLRDAWWRDMVLCSPTGPDGQVLSIVGLDSAIIQNPRTWQASGHLGAFSDPMVDCRETKRRYRADHVWVFQPLAGLGPYYAYVEGEDAPVRQKMAKAKRDPESFVAVPLLHIDPTEYERTIGPDTRTQGTLTAPKQFNLMFSTTVGATSDDDATAYLRPETAQGIFLNYKNVLDTSRVSMPFGIAQIGKAFRNEVTPRNFIFRSREFEQMEMEWFCPPDQAAEWYTFWSEIRLQWWKNQGIASNQLRLRQHTADELAHYAIGGSGTCDIEYKYPFGSEQFGELEGVAHRTDFDLLQHQTVSGKKLATFDPNTKTRYLPHVIEPAAGLTRGLLVLLCEAYTLDPSRPSPEIMRFKPSLAPIKAGIFPLTKKDGLPDIAHKLFLDLRQTYPCQFDAKQSIGKRYARMDEAGTPYCFTIDHQTLTDQTVTVRDRDTGAQQRIALSQVQSYLATQLASS